MPQVTGPVNPTPGTGGQSVSQPPATPPNPQQKKALPGLKTLVYSPDCRIYIARGISQYDISKDLVGGGIRRVENSASSLQFRCTNKGLRYNTLFKPMDRVVVFLKRTVWVQVFSGYLDSVPFKQLYEGVVNFTATCTLKRLMYTYWDPGLPDSQQLLQQSQYNESESADGQGQTDTGLGSLLRRLLIDVGGWKESNIHIQEFPQFFLNLLDANVKKRHDAAEKSTQAFRRLILTDDTSGGQGAAGGRQQNAPSGPVTGPQGAGAAFYQSEIMAAVDEKRMGPKNQDVSAAQTLRDAGQKGIEANQARGMNQDGNDTVAWDTARQTGQAATDAARDSDALILCFMTVMVEAPGFTMYANRGVPESLNFHYDAIGSDYDSCGLFQQRDNGAWGSVAQRMNARASAGMFLNALAKYDWRNMQPGVACQKVQGSNFPEKYQPHFQEAKELARTLRQAQAGGTGTGAAPPPKSEAESAVAGAVPIPGVPSVPNAPAAVPTPTNSPASPGEARSRVGKPSPDSEGAINWAMTQLGVPYGQGQQRPGIELDCSGLCMFAYRSIGIEVGRTTWDQAAKNKHVPGAQAKRGNIVQPHTGHSQMYLGDGTCIETYNTGHTVEIRSCNPGGAANVLYVCDNGGPDPSAPFEAPEKRGPGLPSGAATATGPDGSGSPGSSTGGTSEPIARNLFSWMFTGDFTSQTSVMFEGEKAYLNDEPLINTIQAVVSARLCNFASGPNGDFVCYYPDWWGLDQTGAKFDLEDIEMKNVQIDLNDNALATHVYIAGDWQYQTGSPIDWYGWLGSEGTASVEDEFLFKFVQLFSPGAYESLDGQEIMRRYGVRPFRQEFSSIADPRLEFLIAVQYFMRKWGEQYSTSVQFTFMPELFPGMRLNLIGHNLQVYVTEVNHTFDFESGFTTSAVITAPSNPIAGIKVADAIGLGSQSPATSPPPPGNNSDDAARVNQNVLP
jgi:cell wall-associated NlpC family hydrolase